jgi:hypothetical protein
MTIFGTEWMLLKKELRVVFRGRLTIQVEIALLKKALAC